MQHHPEGDMPSNTQTEGKNNPFAHHGCNQAVQERWRWKDGGPATGGLGGRRLGRFDFRRSDKTREVICHEVQCLFPTISAATLFASLD